MSKVFQRAVGLRNKHLAQPIKELLQSVTTTAIELGRPPASSDRGYVLVDHCGDKGVRKTMEDECVVCESLRALCPDLPAEHDFAVCGLFDGHGGRQSALFARDNLLGEVASHLSTRLCTTEVFGVAEDFDVTFKKAVNAACRRLDARIANEVSGCSDGATALLVFIGRAATYVLNLGDSAAYLCRRVDGVLHSIPLNRIHKPWDQDEKARVQKFGGTIEGGRVNGLLEVTRSFGDLQLKKFGVLCVGSFRKVALDFARDELIVLACDGFWAQFDASDACRRALDLVAKVGAAHAQEELRASATPDLPFPRLRHVCRELVDLAVNVKRAQDNVTVMLVRFRPR